MTEFERLLDECLEALREGRWSIDECIEHYPAYAAALRPRLLTAATVAHACAVQPRPEFAAAARERFLVATGQHLREALDLEPSLSFFAAARVRFLMAAHRMKRETVARRRRLPRLVFGHRALAGSAAALLLVLSFSTYTVASASSALPGDWRYPIKLETERVRLALAFSESDRRDVRLDIAEERAREIQELARKGRIIGAGELTRLVKQTQPLASDASAGGWDASELARLQAVAEKQKQVLRQVAPQVAPAAKDQLVQAVDVSTEALRISSVELVHKDAPLVLTPTNPLKPTPQPQATPTPAAATPSSSASAPLTPGASPTAVSAAASPTGVATAPPSQISLSRTPVDAGLGVTWMRLRVGSLTALIPSEKDGWHIAGVNVADGPQPAPVLVHLSNADGTSLITLNPRNGDMYWYLAHDGRFDEIQMRITQGGQTLVIDPDVLHAAYGSQADIPLFVLASITLEPPPALAPTPAATAR